MKKQSSEYVVTFEDAFNGEVRLGGYVYQISGANCEAALGCEIYYDREELSISARNEDDIDVSAAEKIFWSCFKEKYEFQDELLTRNHEVYDIFEYSKSFENWLHEQIGGYDVSYGAIIDKETGEAYIYAEEVCYNRYREEFRIIKSFSSKDELVEYVQKFYNQEIDEFL